MIADDVGSTSDRQSDLCQSRSCEAGIYQPGCETEEFVAEYMNKMAADEKLSVETAENPKTIIIDYGGPNVAKPLHVGHLRSAIIGRASSVSDVLLDISDR